MNTRETTDLFREGYVSGWKDAEARQQWRVDELKARAEAAETYVAHRDALMCELEDEMDILKTRAEAAENESNALREMLKTALAGWREAAVYDDDFDAIDAMDTKLEAKAKP